MTKAQINGSPASAGITRRLALLAVPLTSIAIQAARAQHPLQMEEFPMIDRIDHFVLTVDSLEATCTFYETVLGFVRKEVPGKPTALTFGHQKINVHQVDHTFEPKAAHPTPGAGDFCLITRQPVSYWIDRLKRLNVSVEEGPVPRNGAEGPMTSIYFRDPDRNLVEVSRYEHDNG